MQKPTAEVKAALKGLTFRDVKAEPVLEEGKPKKDKQNKPVTKNVAITRPMTEEDILDWAGTEEGLVIVSKDGTKHRIVEAKKDAAK